MPGDGEFVEIEYTGRTADGKVFDTTHEGVAKESGILHKEKRYGPQLIILGRGQIIAGLEEALRGMNEGEQKGLSLEPDKAFGARNKELLRIMPLSEFRRQKIEPVPGLVLSLDGNRAVVKRVESGRVLVDFNHPLAGEKVSYELKLSKMLKDPAEKAQSLIGANGLSGKAKLSGSELEVSFDGASNTPEFILGKRGFLDSVKAFIPEVKSISIREKMETGEKEKKE